MQFPREARRPSEPVRNPDSPTEYESFLALLQQGLGVRLCQLLDGARTFSVAYPLSEFSADARRKLHLVTASDAMRLCLEHRYGIEISCTAEHALDLRSSADRSPRPPMAATGEVYTTAQDELPLAMGIINLVHDHVCRGEAGYYAHTPIGLDDNQRDQLVRLMSNRAWRKVLEMRYGVHFGFRAPFHLAAARVIDNNYLRHFVSLGQQVHSGLSLSDP